MTCLASLRSLDLEHHRNPPTHAGKQTHFVDAYPHPTQNHSLFMESNSCHKLQVGLGQRGLSLGRRAIDVEPEPDVGHVLDPLQPRQPTVELLPKEDRLVIRIGDVCVRGDGDDDPAIGLREGARIVECSLDEIRRQMFQSLKDVDDVEKAFEGELRIRDVIIPEGDILYAEF